MIVTLDDGRVLDYSAAASAGAADQALRGLVSAIKNEGDSVPLKLRQGVVTATNLNGTITAIFGASTKEIPGLHCVETFMPVIGDSIWAIQNGADILVLGAQRVDIGPVIPVTPVDTGWVALTLNLGGTSGTFTAVSGYPLEYRTIGNRTEVHGMANFATSALTNNITKLPAAACPTSTRWLCVTKMSTTTCVAQISVAADGTLRIPSTAYYTGTPTAGGMLAVYGSFLID